MRQVVLLKKLSVFFLLLLTLNACGTVDTRTGDTSFGGYPYQAVGHDIKFVVDEPPAMKALSVISMPFDFVLDTLFLAPDLVLWGMGREKDGFRMRLF